MTIQQAIEKLQEEKRQQLPARYHCRAIMVRDVAQYIELLEQLKTFNDVTIISADDLFSGADVLPNYEKLTGKEYQDRWVVLPGVSEYLRLFHASEEKAQRFGALWHFQSAANTKGRVIIPLWGCETLWFDKALCLCDDIRQKEFYFDCCTEGAVQEMSIQVLSGEFEQYLAQLETNHGSVFCGIKEWYSFWCDPKEIISDQLILTRRYRSIKPTDGDIKIHIIRDTLSFIQENLGNGELLNIQNCPKECQEELFSSALTGKSVDDSVLYALNTHDLRPIDIMGKWMSMSIGQKQLVYLWYSIHPDDTYLCHCIKHSPSVEKLPETILMSIFPVRVAHKDWVQD